MIELDPRLAILNLEIIEITPHTYVANYKDYYDLNAGAIILENSILCIDTLYYPKQARMFKDYLENKFNKPVKYLLITHYHGDHLFGMSAFEGAEILGTRKLTANMKERRKKGWTRESFDNWKKTEPELSEIIDEITISLPTIEFEQEYELKEGSSYVKFFRSGGHSGCSSMAYFPAEKVLFTGDEVASGYWIFLSDRTGSPEDWIEAFEKVLDLEIDYVIPGHGPVVTKDYIREQLEFMKKLRSKVKEAIKKGIQIEEIKVPEYRYEPATDWQIPEALKFLFEFYSK